MDREVWQATVKSDMIERLIHTHTHTHTHTALQVESFREPLGSLTREVR